MSELAKTYIAEITGDKPCSELAIHKARLLFKENFADEPTEIVLSPLAWRIYHATVKTPTHYDIDTIMGMEVVLDEKIGKGEWCVRKADRKVYALRSNPNE